MSNKSYKDKSVELSRLCHKKEGRVAGAEKIVEIAHNPDKMFLDLPDADMQDSNCKLYETRNRAGMVLQTTQEPKVEGKNAKKYDPASMIYTDPSDMIS